MAILAQRKQREPIPAGNYVARCFEMIEIGTISDEYKGEPRSRYRVRIGWELPTEKKVFREDRGEEPLMISKEYTLSMHEKSALRADLKSWRGKDFSPDEAKAFDITKLLGAPCMLNITHAEATNGSGVVYDNISAITPLLKGFDAPKAINPIRVLSYDNWSQEIFDALPEYMQTKIKSTPEYAAMTRPQERSYVGETISEPTDDLPF